MEDDNGIECYVERKKKKKTIEGIKEGMLGVSEKGMA